MDKMGDKEKDVKSPSDAKSEDKEYENEMLPEPTEPDDPPEQKRESHVIEEPTMPAGSYKSPDNPDVDERFKDFTDNPEIIKR